MRRGRLPAVCIALTVAGSALAAAPRHAELEGTWTLGSFTDLQRPAELKSLVLTPAEAEAYEAPRRELGGMLRDSAGLGQSDSEFNERGNALARVHGQIRSSWITEPADGRIPYIPEVKTRLGVGSGGLQEGTDNPEELNPLTRCLTNQSAGAPMVGAPDANLFQIVETPAHVAILTEKYHEVRIVRLNAPQSSDPRLGGWVGTSVGRWQGRTLVVETTGLRQGVTLRGAGLVLSGRSRVVERFSRIGRDKLLYQFTVEDPTLFTQVWKAEMVLDRAPGRIFEFACHEGNYALPNILAGARREGHAKPPAP